MGTHRQRPLPRYEMLPYADVDFEAWKEIVLPTMNVHLLGLHQLPKTKEFVNAASAMHYCNICIPYSAALFCGSLDPNALISKIVDLVLLQYAESKRGVEVLQLGQISKRIVNHKKKEYEMGGLRFVVSACASDRPASSLLFIPHDDNPDVKKSIELLHMYVAMGLSKQHDMQRVILCRVRDFGLAKVIVDVTRTELQIDHLSVRELSKDAKECKVMKQLWLDICPPREDAAVLANMTEVEGAEEAKRADSLLGCATFLHSLHGTNTTIEALLKDVMQIVFNVDSKSSEAGAASSLGDTPEPEVNYTWEAWDCQVPPGEVVLPGIIERGKLFWGGLSHVLDKTWLRWRRVTHVVNCLGAKRMRNGVASPDPCFTRAVEAHVDGIEYFDWCINHGEHRNNFMVLFSNLETILTSPGTCLYIHCRSGRDRSVMTVIALLRIKFGVSKDDACMVVKTRLGTRYWPCANLDDKDDLFEWIDSVLSS